MKDKTVDQWSEDKIKPNNQLAESIDTRCRVLGPRIQTSEVAPNMSRAKRLGHVLCIPKERLSRCRLSDKAR